MIADQVNKTRRILRRMNGLADALIDRQAGRTRVGGTNQVAATRSLLQAQNDAADRAIDKQVAGSTPMTTKVALK